MNSFQRFLSWLYDLSIFRKRIKSKKIKISLCAICHKKPDIINTFHCPYCQQTHCDKHRLPENHGCLSPNKPSELHAGRIIFQKGKTVYKKN